MKAMHEGNMKAELLRAVLPFIPSVESKGISFNGIKFLSIISTFASSANRCRAKGKIN